VEVTPSDLARLDPDEFLNDTIIDFYMRRAPDLAFGSAACLGARLMSVADSWDL
jgi:hypothetical protein